MNSFKSDITYSNIYMLPCTYIIVIEEGVKIYLVESDWSLKGINQGPWRDEHVGPYRNSYISDQCIRVIFEEAFAGWLIAGEDQREFSRYQDASFHNRDPRGDYNCGSTVPTPRNNYLEYIRVCVNIATGICLNRKGPKHIYRVPANHQVFKQRVACRTRGPSLTSPKLTLETPEDDRTFSREKLRLNGLGSHRRQSLIAPSVNSCVHRWSETRNYTYTRKAKKWRGKDRSLCKVQGPRPTGRD